METMKWYGLDISELPNGDYVQMGWRWRTDRNTREYFVSGVIEGVDFREQFDSEESNDNKSEAHEFYWAMEDKLLNREGK
jgi:hypothetical protein